MADQLELRTTHLKRQDPQRAVMTYDRQLDTLYIKLDTFGGLHVAHYLDDGVYALFDPDTLEVVGFQVEAWKRVFLHQHPDLRWPWRMYRLGIPSVRVFGGLPLLPQPEQPILETVQLYTPRSCTA
jgi:hypothetical protein